MKKDKKSVWVFSTLYLMGLSIYMLKSLVGVSFPFLKTEYHLTAAELGNIAAAFFWTYSISFLVLGVLTRKIGVKKHAVLTFVGMGICEILFASSSSYSAFLLIKAVEGVMAAGFFLCSASIICAVFCEKKSKQIQAYQISSVGISSLVIAVLLVPLMDFLSWRAGYIVVGILCLIIAVLIIKFVPNVRLVEKHERSVPFRSILFRKTTTCMLVNMLFINIYLYAILNFAVLYFADSKGFSIQTASYLSAINAVVAFLCILLMGYLTKYFRPKKIYLCLIILIAVLGLGIVYTPFYIESMALAYGCSFGGFSMLMSLVQQLYTKNEIPVATGIVNFGGALGGAIAPSLFGLILTTTNNDYNMCFIVLSILVLFSVFTILPITKHDETRKYLQG
ncbi:MAG: MFS transporter [bacterium]|nr:MFS transporter [bacterium]